MERIRPHTVANVTGHYSAGIGRIEDIWVNPDNENLIYISSRSGGFWKTTNGGGEWNGNGTDFYLLLVSIHFQLNLTTPIIS